MGFGGPYLLPTYIGDCSFDCSSADFSAVVYKYGLRYGVAGQNIGSSKLQNFGLDAKLALRNVLVKIFNNLEPKYSVVEYSK